MLSVRGYSDLYKYRSEVAIPPLSMVDDVAAISECGVEAVEVNSYLNTKTNLKRLQYGTKKCRQMHVGVPTPYSPDLYIKIYVFIGFKMFLHGVLLG